MKVFSSKRKLYFILLLFTVVTVLWRGFFWSEASQQSQKPLVSTEPALVSANYDYPPPLVAHAGGGYQSEAYTNSLEALNYNYDIGFRWFEVDFERTADGETIALHDWDTTFSRIFDAPALRYSLEDLEVLPKKLALTIINADEFNQWVSSHGDVTIIADPKHEYEEILNDLENRERIIPFVTFLDEIAIARSHGYDKLIFKHLFHYSDSEIKKALVEHRLFGFSAPAHEPIPDLINSIVKMDIPIFIFTSNSMNEFERFRSMGVSSLLTDFLKP